MLKLFLPLFIMLFLFQGITSAEFYKWEDEDGNVHITDYPPPGKSAKNIKVHKTEPGPANVSPSKEDNRHREYKTPSAENTKPRRSHDVILYTTSWCPYCKMARDFFKSRNIYFTEYDIEKDRDAAERKKRLDSKGGVPFVIVNGQQIHGYSQSAYERALQ